MLEFHKKGDSLVVSYVLLVSITLAIAAFAYGWLKFQADISEPENCPEGVSLSISDYSIENLLILEELNVTLLNRGRFNIDGFFVRINNQTEQEGGAYSLGRFDVFLQPGNSTSLKFNQTNYGVNISIYDKVCFIEVQPFVISSKKQMLLCPQMSTKKVPC